MLVRELMEQLETCDPESEVWVQTRQECEEDLQPSEGVNCILERVWIYEDDEPMGRESFRARGGKDLPRVPVLVIGPNE